jgi:hypothetical protein
VTISYGSFYELMEDMLKGSADLKDYVTPIVVLKIGYVTHGLIITGVLKVTWVTISKVRWLHGVSQTPRTC